MEQPGIGWNRQEWDRTGRDRMEQAGMGCHSVDGMARSGMGCHRCGWDGTVRNGMEQAGRGWQEQSRVRDSGAAGPRRVPAASPRPSRGRARGFLGARPVLAPPPSPHHHPTERVRPRPAARAPLAPPLRGTSGGSGGLLPFPGAGPGRSGGTGAGHGGAGAGAEPERGAHGDQARGFRGRSAPGPAGEVPAGGPGAGGRRPRGAARPRSGGGAGPRPRCPSTGRAELRDRALRGRRGSDSRGRGW